MTLNTSFHWLSVILLLPGVAAALLIFVPQRSRKLVGAVTLISTLAVAVLVGLVLLGYGNAPRSAGVIDFRFTEQIKGFPGIGSTYHLGIDGVGAWFLALNAGVYLLAALVISWREQERIKIFCILLLLSETATAGVILSLDLLLFYIFWEAMLIPLYFILSRFGGEKRGPATLKFIIYTVAGSLAMLLSIIYLSINASNNGGGATFDFPQLLHYAFHSGDAVRILGVSTLSPGQWAFLGFLAAFAIKIPLVPFHTWLPDLYESCPVGVLVFFAGIVSKLGAFGLIR